MATKKTDNVEVKDKAVKEEEEKVLIMIPYIEGDDPEVTVGINGKFTKIKKGAQVYVSKDVAEVIMNSNKQAMLARENQKKFESQRTDL
jgi:ribosome biogenesis protein Tsr3